MGIVSLAFVSPSVSLATSVSLSSVELSFSVQKLLSHSILRNEDRNDRLRFEMASLEVLIEMIDQGDDPATVLVPDDVYQTKSYNDVSIQYELSLTRNEIAALGTECPRCKVKAYYLVQIQKKRGDEPASTYGKCQNCGFYQKEGVD